MKDVYYNEKGQRIWKIGRIEYEANCLRIIPKSPELKFFVAVSHEWCEENSLDPAGFIMQENGDEVSFVSAKFFDALSQNMQIFSTKPKKAVSKGIPPHISRLLADERERQSALGHTSVSDSRNSMSDWAGIVLRYLSQACDMHSHSRVDLRTPLVKAAATLIAAIEANDANNGMPLRHWEEPK